MKIKNPVIAFFLILVFAALACNLPNPSNSVSPVNLPSATLPPPSPTPANLATATEVPSPTPELPTPTIEVPHSLIPSTDVKAGKLIVDVVSADTGPQKHAPYGDAYDINRLERPFLQDMTYVADMDIASFNLAYDEKFFYVSIELVGTNPNNQVGINYGVELDIEGDGFGDVLIVAYPPYKPNWSTDNVQVRRDTNRDTGGLSGEKSDAPLPGDGYDKVIFDGGRGPEDDPDLAWVRVNAGNKATVQFAFKRSLAGAKFMYGVFADGGIRDVEALDYVDRFTEEEAGSPVRSDPHYPLKALYGMDTVCREVFGFKGTNQEPQRCSMIK
ncbi:MAG: hypothetical protein LDL50_06870 [Chloroflexi bacterium]|nr:hypothetical protein [Chloroflexota bacterium]MCA2002538.1 hypothetical protein [Chloroflexota bacterium]